MCQVNPMVKLPALLSIGLLSAIVATEILGLTRLANPLLPHHGTAVAAPGKKRPYRRASGAKRGVCRTNATQPREELMAFLPEGRQVVDRTTTNAPTFYFYVPDRSENIAGLEFRLDYASGDKRGNGVINPPLSVPISSTPGMVKVQLPAVLVKDTTYAWSLTLRCQGTREAVSFKGLVLYQDLDAATATQIAQATSAQQKAAIYAQAGFVMDAVPIVMEDTSRPTQDFEALIAAIGLAKPTASAPVNP
jgi:hypothetical protein